MLRSWSNRGLGIFGHHAVPQLWRGWAMWRPCAKTMGLWFTLNCSYISHVQQCVLFLQTAVVRVKIWAKRCPPWNSKLRQKTCEPNLISYNTAAWSQWRPPTLSISEFPQKVVAAYAQAGDPDAVAEVLERHLVRHCWGGVVLVFGCGAQNLLCIHHIMSLQCPGLCADMCRYMSDTVYKYITIVTTLQNLNLRVGSCHSMRFQFFGSAQHVLRSKTGCTAVSGHWLEARFSKKNILALDLFLLLVFHRFP